MAQVFRVEVSSAIERLVAIGCACALYISVPTFALGDIATVSSLSDASNADLQEVVVTARKQSESIVEVPESITALTAESLKDFNIQTFDDYATKIPNLNFTYGQGGYSATQSLSIAIRGISGPNTTAFYIDDTPVPATINPRILDIDRIEVLKGPQGTLYGAASMGGNVRLVTAKPEIDSSDGSYMVQGGGTSGAGSPDYGGTAVGNFVAIPGVMGVRVTGFYQHDGGFLTNNFPALTGNGTESSGDQGSVRTYGGSIAARAAISEDFDVTLRWLDQTTLYGGLREAYAPLPEFLPEYNLDRTVDLPETASSKFDLVSLDLEYHANALDITSSTSYFHSGEEEKENGTEGTVEGLYQFFGVTFSASNPVPWGQSKYDNQFVEEARATMTFNDEVRGILGFYQNEQWGSLGFPPAYIPGLSASGLWPTNLIYSGDSQTRDSQTALFGELYYKFLKRFTLTVGGRYYDLHQSFNSVNEGFFNGGTTDTGWLKSQQSGFSPKLALSYQTTEKSNLYASYSSGFRPGGPQVAPPAVCGPASEFSAYGADKVYTSELGFKTEMQNHSYLTLAVFQTYWKNIQQPVVLASCDTVITANSGEARIRGGEFELNGELVRELWLHAGVGLLDAVITEQGESSLMPGQRIFQVPKVTGTIGLQYVLPSFGQGHPYVSADYSYVGNRMSDNNVGSVPLQEPGYAVTNAKLGFEFGKSDINLYMKNIANAKPNLGDVQQVSFPQSVPGPNGTRVPYLEVAVMPPFQIGLQFSQHF